MDEELSENQRRIAEVEQLIARQRKFLIEHSSRAPPDEILKQLVLARKLLKESRALLLRTRSLALPQRSAEPRQAQESGE